MQVADPTECAAIDGAGKDSGAPVAVSVICPFFNEAKIIEQAVKTLLARLEELGRAWELIVVNDGSTDASLEIVSSLAEREPRLKMVSYPFNRGRGYALRQGISIARNDIVVTTEIDLSWGEDIVHRLIEAMEEHPHADIVVASPHLRGGGYENVPVKRVLFSRFGNHVIRACIGNVVTMNTGMTRAYRREVIQSLPLEEDGKEFHLEVVLKAQALGYRFHEIPCVLEWKDYKHEGRRLKRKSSSNIKKLVVSHSLFSLFANPIRYVWGLSIVGLLASLGFLIAGVIRFTLGLVSVYMLIVSLSLVMISLMFFAFGVIAQQNNMVQKEIWTLKRSLKRRSQNGAYSKESTTVRESR